MRSVGGPMIRRIRKSFRLEPKYVALLRQCKELFTMPGHRKKLMPASETKTIQRALTLYRKEVVLPRIEALEREEASNISKNAREWNRVSRQNK